MNDWAWGVWGLHPPTPRTKYWVYLTSGYSHFAYEFGDLVKFAKSLHPMRPTTYEEFCCLKSLAIRFLMPGLFNALQASTQSHVCPQAHVHICGYIMNTHIRLSNIVNILHHIHNYSHCRTSMFDVSSPHLCRNSKMHLGRPNIVIFPSPTHISAARSIWVGRSQTPHLLPSSACERKTQRAQNKRMDEFVKPRGATQIRTNKIRP